MSQKVAYVTGGMGGIEGGREVWRVRHVRLGCLPVVSS